jgi:16S rRNA (uracil1498-N3)-methyltransferase
MQVLGWHSVGVEPGAEHRPDRRLPFALVEDVEAPALSPADHHHLARVRRLRDGDPLIAGDGAGRFRRVRLGTPLVPDGDVVSVPAPSPRLTVAFALTKGDRPELVVQKLVEIGIDRIVPFTAERGVVRWDVDKAARNVGRWRAIAREAAAQAHRPWLADVDDVRPFGEVAAELGRDAGAALAHPDAVPGPAPAVAHPAPTTVLVGPEGGWSATEETAVGRWIGLGPNILRAETAAIVAASRIVAAYRT